MKQLTFPFLVIGALAFPSAAQQNAIATDEGIRFRIALLVDQTPSEELDSALFTLANEWLRSAPSEAAWPLTDLALAVAIKATWAEEATRLADALLEKAEALARPTVTIPWVPFGGHAPAVDVGPAGVEVPSDDQVEIRAARKFVDARRDYEASEEWPLQLLLELQLFEPGTKAGLASRDLVRGGYGDDADLLEVLLEWLATRTVELGNPGYVHEKVERLSVFARDVARWAEALRGGASREEAGERPYGDLILGVSPPDLEDVEQVWRDFIDQAAGDSIPWATSETGKSNAAPPPWPEIAQPLRLEPGPQSYHVHPPIVTL